MTVKIQCSKTDQLRQGDEVLIARMTNSTCPVSMMERYMRMAGIDQRSEAYLSGQSVSAEAAFKPESTNLIDISFM